MATSLKSLDVNHRETTCAFHFLKRSPHYDVQKPYYFSGALEESQEKSRSNLEYDIHDGISVTDLRGSEQNLSLAQHGFELLHHEAVVDLTAPTEDEINQYLEDVAERVKQHLGAEVALAYSFRFRREKMSEDTVKSKVMVGTFSNQDVPVLVPHTDQTLENGLKRVQFHLNEQELKKYMDGNWRIRIMNCWRPLNRLADERPLAMCDYTSLDKTDLRSADRASREYVGEIYYIHHNPEQQWYWISGQKPDEMLLFTNFDSKPGKDVPFMVHSAFVNKDAAGLDRRESLETAIIVISRD